MTLMAECKWMHHEVPVCVGVYLNSDRQQKQHINELMKHVADTLKNKCLIRLFVQTFVSLLN